jgi:hypothetical protein
VDTGDQAVLNGEIRNGRWHLFNFYDGKCQFFCDPSVCVGHDMHVEENEGSAEITGDKVYFILEAAERARGEFIWEQKRVDWGITSV